MRLRIERMALAVIVGLIALFAVLVVVGCDSNIVSYTPPAEADPQFVIMRRYHSESAPDIWVIKDKVSNREFYLSQTGGIAFVDSCPTVVGGVQLGATR